MRFLNNAARTNSPFTGAFNFVFRMKIGKLDYNSVLFFKRLQFSKGTVETNFVFGHLEYFAYTKYKIIHLRNN